MQLIFFDGNEIIYINIFAWLIFHLLSALIGTVSPDSKLDAKSFVFRIRDWERKSDIYKNIFKVHKWKHLLPDAGSWFKNGFAKRKMSSLKSSYMQVFVRETCRAELIHWLGILPAALFFLWNVWWVGLIMVGYALLVNMPCILAQRYNRIRFTRILENRILDKKRS